MAGILVAGVIAAGSSGIDKYKSKKAAKQKARQEEAENLARELYFKKNTGKAQEAAFERELAEREVLAEDRPSSSGARAGHGLVDTAPPPYTKDAPGYEEHYAHARTINNSGATAQDHPAVMGKKKSDDMTRRPDETEEQYKRRMRVAYFKRGDFWQLVGAGMANGC